jgi:RNA polymerase sigma factor (sigma-70 family)
VSPVLARRLSDEHLGRRLAAGEAPAFDELYRRYVHRLAAYGTHLLGDAAAGDDVAQVALMRAYQSLRGGRIPSALRPWLYRIAHNAAIDAVRSRYELPTASIPENLADARDVDRGALISAIAALPGQQRRVYVLRELHGLRIAETGAELGLTNQQVEQALFAARNRLAEQLVFGERLGCASVRQLAAGPLDSRERRGLKTHVRSCPDCRRDLGLRGVALSLPGSSSAWLQWLLAGGGAPAAAKIGAAVATVTIAAGAPLAETHHGGHAQRLTLHVAPRVASHSPVVRAQLVSVAATVSRPRSPVSTTAAVVRQAVRPTPAAASKPSPGIAPAGHAPVAPVPAGEAEPAADPEPAATGATGSEAPTTTDGGTGATSDGGGTETAGADPTSTDGGTTSSTDSSSTDSSSTDSSTTSSTDSSSTDSSSGS